jgi:hypothetical protein
MSLVLRSRAAPSVLAPSLRQVVWSVDSEQPVGNIQTMRELEAENMGGDQLIAGLMEISAILALILAGVGSTA